MLFFLALCYLPAYALTPFEHPPHSVQASSRTLVPPVATDIAAGFAHTCAAADGGVWCWGTNTYGQLGDGTKNQPTYTTKVKQTAESELRDVTAIAAGEYHSCAVSAGTVWCWGRNNLGQLGKTDILESAYPVQVLKGDDQPLDSVTMIASKHNHTCALSAGALYCWGANESAQLGIAASVFTASPVLSLSTSFTNISKIAVGWNDTCVITNGNVKCISASTNATVNNINPNNFLTLSDGTIFSATDLSLGINHRCATTNFGTRCWGNNANGQLGTSTSSFADSEAYPANIRTQYNYVDSRSFGNLATGAEFSCANADSQVFCWGRNSAGQLGNAWKTYSFMGGYYPSYNRFGIPISVVTGTTTSLQNSTKISSNANHTCAIVAGKVFCWGSNHQGAVGTGANKSVGYASEIPLATVDSFGAGTEVRIGAGRGCLLTEGVMWCWGYNNGFLRNNNSAFQSAPRPVLDETGTTITGIDKISEPGEKQCYEKSRRVYCFDSIAISQVTKSTGAEFNSIQKISSGPTHGCVIDSGEVWCWGSNWTGQLGSGNTTTSITAVKVIKASGSAITGVIDIGLGYEHTCAATVDTVWCWGSNVMGQLGNGTSVNSTFAVQATKFGGGALENVTRLGIGNHHSCAQMAQSIWCWGFNSNGQIGNGTKTNANSAVWVSGLPNRTVTDLDAGGASTCALFEGEPYCWGAYTGLAHGGYAEALVPTEQFADDTSSLYRFEGISVGNSTRCGIRTLHYREVWCFGHYNLDGQLGDGTLINRVGAVKVSFDYASGNVNATAIPTPTPTLTSSATVIDTSTVPALTDTYTPSNTATNIPTDTYTPSNTATNIPTETYTSTNTPSETPTATSSNTPTNIATASKTATPTFPVFVPNVVTDVASGTNHTLH